MSKHEAEQSTSSQIREHHAAQQAGFGISREGWGKHRAIESFNPMTGVTTTFGPKQP